MRFTRFSRRERRQSAFRLKAHRYILFALIKTTLRFKRLPKRAFKPRSQNEAGRFYAV